MNRLWRVCTLSRQVFDEMKDKTPILFPLLLVVGVTLILWFFTFISAVFNLFNVSVVHQLFTEDALQNNFFVSRDTLLEKGVGSLTFEFILLGLLSRSFELVYEVGVRLLLLGTYFYIIARCLRIDIKWENWLRFGCWTYIPMAVIPAVSNIVDELVPWNFSSYLFAYVLWFVSLLLPIMWSMSITVQGLRSWTTQKTAFCIGVAAIPYVLIFLSYAPSILQSILVINFPFPR